MAKTQRLLEKQKDNNEEVVENHTKVAETGSKEPLIKHSTVGIVASKDTINLDMFGGASDDIYVDLNVDNDETELQYNTLTEHMNKANILYGVVSGVDVDTTNQYAIVTLIWNNTRVLIHENQYFEKTFNFGDGFATMSFQEKLDKKIRSARYNIGSRCPFIISEVSKMPINEGYFEGDYEVVAVASRVKALAKIRDKYFVHKNTNNPVNVPVNARAKANVIYVCESYVTVECLGVETRIDAYNLNENYVANCGDFVSVGDVILVRIKKEPRINGEDVYLSVSGRLNNGSKSINALRVGGSYLGEVESFNKGKRLYTIRLKTGVVVSVLEKAVQGHIELNPGDRAAVLITDVKPEGYAVGMAMKI